VVSVVRQLKISRNVPRVGGSDLCAVRLTIYTEKFESSYLHPVVSTVLLFAVNKGAGNASCGNNIRLSSRSESMVVKTDVASFREECEAYKPPCRFLCRGS
jgi:hypothetical protein